MQKLPGTYPFLIFPMSKYFADDNICFVSFLLCKFYALIVALPTITKQ
jgi:hypothetical protein